MANQERPAATVITGETAEAFYDAQLSPEEVKEPEAKEPSAEEVAAAAEAKAKADAETAEKAELDDAHKQGKLKERFSELTTKRKEAENLAKQAGETARLEREAREKAERETAELRQKYEPPKSEEIGEEPQPAAFQDIKEYAKALTEWATNKALIEARQKSLAEAEQVRAQGVAKSWGERLTATKAELPDFETKVAASPVKVSNEVRDAILESDVGPKLLYHFAEHPEDAERLAKLSTNSALRELGKLEARIAEPAKPKEKPAVEISKAPAPISALKSSSAGVEVIDREKQLPYQEWKAKRAAGKIK